MATTTKARLRALVLDGDAAAVEDVRRALEARRVSVVSADDGERGLAILLDELLDLDVVVTDADLPGRDARSLAHLVRRAGGERDLALVVVAAEATAELCAELRELGVDAVVARSAGPDALAEAVLVAVAARASSTGGGESPSTPELVDAAPRAPRWALSMGRWSLLPA